MFIANELLRKICFKKNDDKMMKRIGEAEKSFIIENTRLCIQQCVL